MEARSSATFVLKTIVVSREAHPELYAELVSIGDGRARCERLRILASLGLFAIRSEIRCRLDHREPDGAKDNAWDGTIRNFSISEGAYPELFRELKELEGRAACDRLRLFATVGLTAGRVAVMAAHPVHQKEESPPETKEPADSLTTKRKALKDKLKRF